MFWKWKLAWKHCSVCMVQNFGYSVWSYTMQNCRCKTAYANNFSCKNEEKVIYYEPELGKKIVDISTELQSSLRQKWKKCERMLVFIAMHYWGIDTHHWKSKDGEYWSSFPDSSSQWSSNQRLNSSLQSQLKRSSKGVIWMYRASFTNSSRAPP